MKVRAMAAVAVFVGVGLASAVASAQDGCPELVAGKSLGPIKLGMTEAELGKLGLAIKPGFSEANRHVGNFQVYLKDGKVESVSLEAGANAENPCVKIAGKLLNPAKARLEELATVYAPHCGPMQFNTGATVIECDQGAMFLQHMGGQDVRVVQGGRAAGERCAAYVAPGEPERAGVNAADVKEGKKVCANSTEYTADFVPEDIVKIGGKAHISTCSEQANRGGTVVECPYAGLKFVFGGPQRKLARVESIKLKQ